jgi:hypothetical protein
MRPGPYDEPLLRLYEQTLRRIGRSRELAHASDLLLAEAAARLDRHPSLRRSGRPDEWPPGRRPRPGFPPRPLSSDLP